MHWNTNHIFWKIGRLAALPIYHRQSATLGARWHLACYSHQILIYSFSYLGEEEKEEKGVERESALAYLTSVPARRTTRPRPIPQWHIAYDLIHSSHLEMKKWHNYNVEPFSKETLHHRQQPTVKPGVNQYTNIAKEQCHMIKVHMPSIF